MAKAPAKAPCTGIEFVSEFQLMEGIENDNRFPPFAGRPHCHDRATPANGPQGHSPTALNGHGERALAPAQCRPSTQHSFGRPVRILTGHAVVDASLAGQFMSPVLNSLLSTTRIWGRTSVAWGSAMPTVSALEFRRRFGLFRQVARREPVEITRNGRREFVLLSAEHYDWLQASAQRTHRTDAATDAVINAVKRAKMDVKHKQLDELLT